MRASIVAIIAGLLMFVQVSSAEGQSNPAPPSTPDTLTRDSLPLDPVGVDSTAKDGKASLVAELKTVRVEGTNSGSSYFRFQTTTATKTPTLLRDIPQAVTVINRALMKDQGMQNLADVVRYVPGMTMGQGEGNRDQPTIRGNSTSADFYVDGVRDDAQYYRDLYNVERVEALKGSNAMIFGRGGGGGVINRVMKEAGWTPAGELTLQGGSFNNKRATLDAGGALSSMLAVRFNGVYEHSDMFRDKVWLKRQGLNPTLSMASPSGNTRVNLGYENFVDHRTADRGIPSFDNAPVQTDVSTFFGNPDVNYVSARVNSGSASVSHAASNGVNIHNQTKLTTYDKIYQNVLPGAVSASGADVSLSAYNNAQQRKNIFNQTDLTYDARTGSVGHTLLLGAELSRQVTDNFRNTGFFNDTAATFVAPVASPTITVPMTFRQSATDASNHVATTGRAIYAQDQVELNRYVQLIAGVRYENFAIRFHNNRTDTDLARSDAMISPRAGLLFKPVTTASIYASYSVSYLPSAGDQFSSLTDVTQALKPEKFANAEAGAKWDVSDRVALTAAAYRLDRSNTRAPNPSDPSMMVQTGSQRSTGYEIGITGTITSRWEVAGGFSRQRAVIVSRTAAAAAGTTVPLVPASTLSLWNKYQFAPRFGLALGVMHQTDMYAAISNTVKLPAFTRVDAGIYYTLSNTIGLQANLENLFNERYYPLAHGNSNITPGSPRAVRFLLTTRF
jgi:catecholate siderophore receptor